MGKAWHYPHVRLRCWSKPEAAENRRAWLGRKASSGLSERKAAAVKSSGRSHMAAFAAPATPSPHLPLRPLPHGRCLTGRCRIGFALVADSSPAPRSSSRRWQKIWRGAALRPFACAQGVPHSRMSTGHARARDRAPFVTHPDNRSCPAPRPCCAGCRRRW